MKYQIINSIINMKSLIFCILTSISLLISACSCTPNILEPSQQAVTIPLGGNAYITTRGEGENGKITENGILQWTNPSTVYSVFFRISKPGQMSLFHLTLSKKNFDFSYQLIIKG